jgi:hypothetical protein
MACRFTENDSKFAASGRWMAPVTPLLLEAWNAVASSAERSWRQLIPTIKKKNPALSKRPLP